MAELTDRQKEYIIAELATYHSPSEVAASFKDEFRIEITRQQAANYDPTTVAGKRMAASWRKLFEIYRNAFLNDRSTIAIAQQNYRLRELDTLFRANKAKSLKMALKILEQAAKEEGGIYQRRVDESGDDGADALAPEIEAAVEKIYKASDNVADVPESSEQ